MIQYHEFAYIYDRLMHQDIDYDAWCDYIENLFTLHSVSPDTLCELACGTGNMTSILASRGYKMAGVDISSDMVMVARSKSADATFDVCDMAQYKPKKKYDAFLCMIDGINYMLTPKAVEDTFRMVKTNLNPDCVFIFDISTEYKLKNILGNETFIHSEDDIFYSWENRYIEKVRLSDMYLNFFVKNGREYTRFEEQHLQRGWRESEIRKLLKRAGFAEISVYDELTMNSPTEESHRIVFVCK